jgi:hypothetical protein
MTVSSEPLMTLEVEVSPPLTVDGGALGRRLIPITGGRVSGNLTGKVLPGGGDWQTIWPDGRMDLDARYVIDIDGHGQVEVISQGLRHGPPDVLAALGRGEAVDPLLYYFRTSMRFRTSAPDLLHLNALLAIAKGAREKALVRLTVFPVD